VHLLLAAVIIAAVVAGACALRQRNVPSYREIRRMERRNGMPLTPRPYEYGYERAARAIAQTARGRRRRR
jgi:hypothetical protein